MIRAEWERVAPPPAWVRVVTVTDTLPSSLLREPTEGTQKGQSEGRERETR